jgi:hypothetical protein
VLNKLLNFEQYKSYYSKNGHLLGRLKTKKSLNDAQILSGYEAYIKSEQKRYESKERQIENSKIKKEIKVDEKWIEVRKQVEERDNFKCRLMSILTSEELKELKENSGGLHLILDPAHFLRRSQYPKMIYDIDNIVLLNRASHTWLDQFRNPLNGKYIGPTQSFDWWIKIIGTEKILKLMKKKGELING